MSDVKNVSIYSHGRVVGTYDHARGERVTDKSPIDAYHPDDAEKKSVGEVLIGGLLSLFLLPLSLGGCMEAPEPFLNDGGSPQVAPPPPPPPSPAGPEGIVFCKKTGVVDQNDDCHKNASLTAKMSTCVYLNMYGYGDEFDHDKLMTFLLGYESVHYQDEVFLLGNNEWPQERVGYNGHSSNDYIYPNSNKDKWTTFNSDKFIRIIPNQENWTIQVWLRQPPDLCWAVYESPCADEASTCDLR
ncbi:MAG: hypothetical protein Q7T03_02240 [Deltaproteobacteria bacterium]|nr:hypothetical protein [Deltaproteobacteria bacterium]